MIIGCAVGSSVPVAYGQPSGYGQPAGIPAGIPNYQQPMMMGSWQPGMMAMPYGSQPGMMAMPAGPVSMQPTPPVGYMQRPVMAVGMQAPMAYQPSTFGTSLHAGAGLRQ